MYKHLKVKFFRIFFAFFPISSIFQEKKFERQPQNLTRDLL